MALPPKGHPGRPLAKAVNAAYVMGVVYLALSVLVWYGLDAVRKRGGDSQLVLILVGILAIMLPMPGILYPLLAFGMKRRKVWAAILLICVAGLHIVMLLLSLAGSFLKHQYSITQGFVAILVAIDILLIIYTGQAIGFIRNGDVVRPTGFEPMFPVPLPSPTLSRGVMPLPVADDTGGQAFQVEPPADL
jgi:hypothetical protein